MVSGICSVGMDDKESSKDETNGCTQRRMYKTQLYLQSFKPHMINIFICLSFSFLYIFKCLALVLEKMFHINPAQQAFSSFRTGWVKCDSFVLKCLVLKIYCKNMSESIHFHGKHPSIFKRILQQRTVYLMTSQIIRGVFFHQL